MSCSLNIHAVIPDLKELKSILCPGTLREEELSTNYDYDNRWSWDEHDDMSDKSSVNQSTASWLNECVVAISPPSCEIVAFARERYLAVYKKDSNSSPTTSSSPVEPKMQLSAASSLAGLDASEAITCLACIPLISQKKSNEGSVDWTAIIVGFSSGTVRIYTENGQLILAQKLSEEPVVSIVCNSFYSPSTQGKRKLGDLDHTDEMMVCFPKSVVYIEGFALYQSLRAARNHLARLQVGKDAIQHILAIGIHIPTSRWMLKEDAIKVSSFASCGIRTTSTYDTFVQQSVAGTSCYMRKDRLLSHSIISTGDTPYVGFHNAFEDDSQAVLTEVAQAVVSTVKSFIPLFGNKKEENKTEVPSIPLRTRLGIFDQNREGTVIKGSPDKCYAVAADEFGRVVLFDTVNFVALRIWKGYRDPECGFIEVSEDASTNSRKSLLLIIHAPKRGIVEIWRCLKGHRIAAFNIGKSSKLIYNNYSIFGLNSLNTLHQIIPKFECFLFDKITGKISTFRIPFVCSVTDLDSKTVRDNHFVKEFKTLLDKNEVENAIAILSRIASVENKKEALLYSIQSDDLVKTLKTANTIQAGMKIQTSGISSDAIEYSIKLMIQMCGRVIQLCKLYEELSKINFNAISVCDFMHNPPSDIEDLAINLGWKPVDVAKCVSLFGLRHSVISSPKSGFEPTMMTISQYFNCFLIDHKQLCKDVNGEFLMEYIPVKIKWSAGKGSSEYFLILSKFLFTSLICEENHSLLIVCDKSVLNASCLLKLLFLFWTSSEAYAEHWKNWASFSYVVRTIASQLGEVTEEDSVLSASWRTICGIIVASTNLSSALIAGYIVKRVASDLSLEKISKTPNEEDDVLKDDDWETLSLDEERLNLLLKQIEDTFLLDLLLRSVNTLQDSERLSLSFLLKSNPGVISEYVSKWAVGAKIEPRALSAICDNTAAEQGNADVEEALETNKAYDVSMYCGTVLDMETVRELLSHVRSCFPYSLEPQVILANCSWEAMTVWDKNSSLSNTVFLKLSLAYLNSITSAVLKHNISCLLWKTFIVRKLEILTTLVEKMAKIPKERICQKDIGMGENCLESFVSYAHDLLECILQNVKAAEFEGAPLFSIDEWWRHQQRNSSRQPLVLMAINLKTSNTAIVLEHVHMTLSLLFIITFQLKSFRPLSLFSNYVKQSMFKELHCTSFDTPCSDYLLNDQRLKFLKGVVTAIAHSIPTLETSDCIGPSSTETYTTANKWFNKAVILAREWEISVDVIRRHFVTELYVTANDTLAGEIISAVNDKTALCVELLEIAAQRVVMLMSQSDNAMSSSLPPNAAMWLQSLNLDADMIPATKSCTKLLLQQIVSHIPEDHQQIKMMNAMLEFVSKM